MDLEKEYGTWIGPNGIEHRNMPHGFAIVALQLYHCDLAWWPNHEDQDMRI